MILLDTHAWLWWVAEDRRLTKRARAAIDRASRGGEARLSAISSGKSRRVEKCELTLDRPLDEWLDAALAHGEPQVFETGRAVLVESRRLPGTFHGDPAIKSLWQQPVVMARYWSPPTLVSARPHVGRSGKRRRLPDTLLLGDPNAFRQRGSDE